MVFTCSDSRVPVELIFDQGVGDLFVVRTAGHVLDDAVTGTLHYGAEVLETLLIVVLGHTCCGAITAAWEKAVVPP
jgi:carbonic anhydrase